MEDLIRPFVYGTAALFIAAGAGLAGFGVGLIRWRLATVAEAMLGEVEEDP
jgi:hypothetical protein